MSNHQALFKKVIIPGLVAFIFVLCAIVVVQLLPWKNTNQTNIEPISFVGVYQAGPDATPFPIQGPLSLSTRDSDEVRLRGSFDRPLAKGTQLFFIIKYLEVHIYLGEEEIYSFSAPGSYPHITRSAGMTWNHCQLPQSITPEDQVTIVLRNNYQNNYYSAYNDFFNSLTTGDSGALARHILNNDWPYILFSILFFFLSLAILIFCMLLTLQKIRPHRCVPLFALCTMALSLHTLLSPSFSTLLIGNTVLVMALELITMLAAGLLMIAYLHCLLQSKAKGVNLYLMVFMLAFTAWTLLLQIFGLCDAYAVRTILMCVISAAALVGIGEVIFELYTHTQPLSVQILIPLPMFLLFLLEMINYAFEFFPPNTLFFYGFFILAILQISEAYHFINSAILKASQAAQLESELAQSRISIMISQIQPHFLYNSLATIKGLCQLNPSLAEQAVDYFSDFLRGNINALVIPTPIPFEQDLYHTQQYLHLEQMRFGARLHILCSTPVTAFRVPSLTLQPIVENAVHHGVTRLDEGGTVSILTIETQDAFVIRVTDDGPGFDPDQPKLDGRPHIGIANVRERLRLQCGGTLSIQSAPGLGATVTISIPKEIKPL